ncbi:MAG: hypothetical protein DMD62_09885 [Gemmatimonadetes bacterium]|nr:MAG: hypothetical protein DMD62_09885 [Gemmatimonadota bacterium]
MRPRTLVLACFLGASACAEPLVPEVSGRFTVLAAGDDHTCALVEDSTAFCWGSNSSLKLGSGGTELRDSLPQLVSTGFAFTQLVAGRDHTCALTALGTAYCWGEGGNGQLGKAGTSSAPEPVAVDGGRTFRAITAGVIHTCALTDAGAAYCWGDNNLKQVGYDTAATTVGTPVPVAGGHTFKLIAAGNYHTCGITSTDDAYCWGANNFGMLGSGDSVYSSALPEPVAGGLKFKSIAGGAWHTCAVTTGGEAYCWGSTDFGLLGTGLPASHNQFTPQHVAGAGHYLSVSLGVRHSCALDVDGRLSCWGANDENQLAAVSHDRCVTQPGSSNFVPCALQPIASAPGHYFQAFISGSNHACGLSSNAAAYCWGKNEQGQIGNGSVSTSIASPARVTDPPRLP